ncbi:hypothetical protein [Mesobacillus maritimus]|uniref:Uncharacterized protein n=1 Tax=Mesobacillus maritimus TaxID=1643336 RepID=A0ABS7K8U7_9BACI|nr:hypothetical protein [Mesobacillus maritimus]MBY0098692.1 hypothetical protein [Mesobacillus maritimus]
MRDRRRIPRIISLLQKIWEQQHDVRFNQLISNLQSQYSLLNDNYGKKEIDSNRGTYLDLFFLEDDKWELFLEDYWREIEEELKKEEAKITDEVINEVINLFLEAGIKQESLDDKVSNNIRRFYLVESRWLTTEAITDLIKNFSNEDRLQLFYKINQGL